MSTLSALPTLEHIVDDDTSRYDARAYRLAQAALRGKPAIDARQFGRVSGIRSAYIRRSVFNGLAGAGQTVLQRDAMARFLTLANSGLAVDRRRAAFMALANGEPQLQERHFGKLLYSALDMPDRQRKLALCRRLTQSMFADPDGQGQRSQLDCASFGQAFDQLEDAPKLLASDEINWLGKLRRSREVDSLLDWLQAPHQRLLLAWIAGFVALCVAVFAWKFFSYRARGADLAIQIARGAAACVNLGTALVVLPMLKGLLTPLHRRLPSGVLPFQSLRTLHKLIGYSLILFSLVHMGGQITHQALLHNDLSQFLLQTMLGITGLVLLLVIGLMVYFARARFYRKPRRYHWFRQSHRLYLVWFALMLWHSPMFWAWAIVPGALYALNRLWQMQRQAQLSCLFALEPLADQVLRVELKRPPGFRFQAGDYLYLRIPEIDRQQWHPFTLSSAPEADRLTLHIRNAGYWTGQLHQLARDKPEGLLPLPVQIDGPYSAPSVVALRSKVTILVAGGIGITPYASLLQHVALQAQQGQMRVKEKIYVFWVCRTPEAVSWIRPILNQLACGPAGAQVDVRIYCSMVQRNLGDLALQIASERYHLRHGRDAATGSPYRLRWGRPQWRQELADICQRHAGESPQLFFCGPTPFAAEIKGHCQKLGIGFAQEIF
ncbi:ferric reductase-like transmembrane domain-containing protein [Chitinimonas sp.]|uniref:NADPH oxidase family protein n=1 Tax=Chitinimonas sp. TaxID=1934313 RepID=UPI0035B35F62